MENRDLDKMSKDPSDIERDEGESESSFGEDTGRSEDWKDEPSRKDESSGWKGDRGGSNLGEQSDVSSSRSGRDLDH